MMEFFKRLLSGGGNDRPAKEEKAVEYNGFTISPRPRQKGGGWSTEAVIRKTLDGETKQHTFVRADASTSKEAAVSLIVSKAKMLIDQQGEKIFKPVILER